AHNKPVMIGEFGCCTYQGAEKLGGSGFIITFGMMADFLDLNKVLPRGVVDMVKIPPRVDGHYIRDESLQACELSEQLAIFETACVEGAFVFTFVSPNSPYNKD